MEKRDLPGSNPEKIQISHYLYGDYEQIIFDDIEEAGHVALASSGEFGWGMPRDPATERFVASTVGKTVLEIGCGIGHTTVVPALESGAEHVYATDISPEHLDASSYMHRSAAAQGMVGRLTAFVLDQAWWDRDLETNPTIGSVLGHNGRGMLPYDGSVDRIIARHSLQFGDVDTTLRFLDVVSCALKPGGLATTINFTPFTGYMHAYDNGETMERIAAINSNFAEGKVELPGGYLNAEKGVLGISLATLMGRSELDRGASNRFIYFDTDTVTGILRVWRESRESRGLPVDLILEESTYFSPPNIARINKLWHPAEYTQKENHVAVLVKTD